MTGQAGSREGTGPGARAERLASVTRGWGEASGLKRVHCRALRKLIHPEQSPRSFRGGLTACVAPLRPPRGFTRVRHCRRPSGPPNSVPRWGAHTTDGVCHSSGGREAEVRVSVWLGPSESLSRAGGRPPLRRGPGLPLLLWGHQPRRARARPPASLCLTHRVRPRLQTRSPLEARGVRALTHPKCWSWRLMSTRATGPASTAQPCADARWRLLLGLSIPTPAAR